MSLEYQKKAPDWQSEGTEPDATLKAQGFQAGYKPPAAYFNWFWSTVSAALKELQEKTAEYASANDLTVEELRKVVEEGGAGSGNTGSPAELLALLTTVDGSGSGLDADMVDGKHASEFASSTHSHGVATTETAGFMSAADKEKLDKAEGVPVLNATTTDGVSYIASNDLITSLKIGLTVIVIPNLTSTAVLPTLNLNGLGTYNIKQGLSLNTSTVVNAESKNWMVASKPVMLQFDGTQWVTVRGRASASDLYGAVAIENGGTGATTPSAALANLGAAPAYTYSTTDLTEGTSPLSTGTLYFVYE